MTSAAYIRTGRLDKRADLQYRVKVTDGGGGTTTTWTTERQVWCGIQERTAAERVQAMREQSQITHEIWARYATDITADKRLVLGSTAYNIRAVLNPEKHNEFLRILAESGVAT